MHYSFLKQISLIAMLLFFPLASYGMTKKSSKASNDTKDILCGECRGTRLSYLSNAITGTAGLGMFIWFSIQAYNCSQNASDIGVLTTSAILTLPLTAAIYFLTQSASNVINKNPFKTPCSQCKWAPADQLKHGISYASSWTLAMLGVSHFKNNETLQFTSIAGSIGAGFTITPWLLNAAGCKAKTTK